MYTTTTTTTTTTKTTLVLVILSVLLLHDKLVMMHRVEAEIAGAPPPASIDCKSKCEYRCSKASREKVCIRACNTCCERCHCVPPGTSGNTHLCPCYANMTSHGGRLKCP